MKVLHHIGAASLVLATFAACSGSAKKSNSAESIVRPLGDNVPVLKYEGGVITAKDVNQYVEPELKRFTEEAVQAYEQAARQTLMKKLVEDEAKKQGKDMREMMQSIVMNAEVSDSEVDAFIKARGLEKGIKDPKTGKMQKVPRDDVKRYLQSQSAQTAQQTFVQGLMAKVGATLVLELPRAKIPFESDMPFLGGADAKVVIHEFSDFECPFCSKGVEAVKQIKEAYGDKVKVVFRHFPLEGKHPNAKPAALATICAHKQGKFWELHDKIFENYQSLSPEAIRSMAKAVGLDTNQLDNCLKDPSAEKALARDLSTAQDIGVNSTPTFFVNGKRVAGALPFAEFKTLIDAELKKF
jgi:protein-disulfide isomerase